MIRPCLRRFLSDREHLNETGLLQQNEVSQLTYSSRGAYKPMGKPMDNPKNKSMDSPMDKSKDNPKNSPMNNSKDKTADKSTDKSKDKTAPRPDLLCVADMVDWQMVRYKLRRWLISTEKPCDSLLHNGDSKARNGN